MQPHLDDIYYYLLSCWLIEKDNDNEIIFIAMWDTNNVQKIMIKNE